MRYKLDPMDMLRFKKKATHVEYKL